MGDCLILKSGGGVDTSNATATSDKILQGYTAYVNDVLVQGSMQYQGSVNTTIQAGTYYTIPEGYHSGYGWVEAEGLTDQTSGTATADKILSKYTAWVNGVKLTGSMTDRGSLTYQLPVNGNYYIPSGYHNGNGRVYQSLSTQGSTTITPGTSSKIACSSGKYTTGTIWVAGDTNLMGENIKKGISIFGVSGTMESNKKFWIYNRGNNPYKFIEASSFDNINFTPGTAIFSSDRIRKVEGNPKARFGIKPIDGIQFSQFNILVLMESNHTNSHLVIGFDNKRPTGGVTYSKPMNGTPVELSCKLPYTKNLTDDFVIGELATGVNTTTEIYEMWLT